MPAVLTLADLAQAVTDALNGAPAGTFSQSFAASRTYVPKQDLAAAAKQLSVLVFQKEDDLQGAASRSQTQDELSIDVGVLKRVAGDPTVPAANAELDALVRVAKEIALFFKPGTAVLSSEVLRARIPLPYDSGMLLREKTFLSVVTVSFFARV